jgi:hypothetical protein
MMPASVLAQPALTTQYWDTNLAFNQCMDVVQGSLTSLKFTDIARTTTAVNGHFGDYSVQVICATAKGMMILIVSGPDGKTAINHAQAIQQKITAAR